MARAGGTVGISPGWLAKLDESQQSFILTATGRRFYDEFITKHGKHLFIFGTTGGGKTQKGYSFVDWLKYIETQVWFDTGKTNEILPLLCMGKKVRIITPVGSDVRIMQRINNKWVKIPDHPEVIYVKNPFDALSSLSKGYRRKNGSYCRDTINIICFRNAFTKKEIAISWVAELFEQLAERCRLRTMPNIFPATIHIDESQWAMAGKRISGEGDRSRASEVITENALELRSIGIRLVLYAQDYKNIPPAARENMLFNVLCKGAHVTTDEDGRLAKWCQWRSWNPRIPTQYHPSQGRFIFENGDSYPIQTPWTFRLYPLDPADREWISHLRVVYEGKFDTRPEQPEEDLIPDLGIYQAMAIKPEEREKILSRWDAPEGYDD